MDDASAIGPRLQRWLARLDEAGFAVGVRERLVVQQLLVQQAASGLLAEPWPQLLARLAPLLCANPRQQAEYQRLLGLFQLEQAAPGVDQGGAGGAAASGVLGGAARAWQALRRGMGRRRGLNLLLVALFVLAAALVWHHFGPRPEANGTAAAGAASAPPAASAPAWRPPALPPDAQVYVAPGSLPSVGLQTAPAPWAVPLAWALRITALAALLGLAVWAWRWRPPPVQLQQARTEAALDEHILRTAPDTALEPQPAATRAVAAALRQRVAGETQVLDLAATLRATLRASGALNPRYRSLKRTPEYLVLLDERQPLDHAAAYARTLVQALREAGVSIATWCFEGTPDDGLWPAQAEPVGAQRLRLLPMAEVAARHVGHRLLVLGSCTALASAVGGQPRPWLQGLGLLSQRVWFTPLPLHAWAGAETAVEEHGFLLLPLQEGALATLAGWLCSEQLSLAVPADWPLAYPALLAGDGQEWVTRQTAPPPAALDELLRQLQLSLGSTRWAWLCACAVFPGLSPALTLALGREVLAHHGQADDARALTLGYTALAALPWFRESFMPLWLRSALVAALEPALQARVRATLQARIDAAAAQLPSATEGAVLAAVATERPAGAAAPTPGGAPARQARSARDVLLARFLAEHELADPLAHTVDHPSLAQRLGLRLRRLAAVPKQAWVPLAGLCTLALASTTPWWPTFERALPQAPLPLIGEPLPLPLGPDGVPALAFSPDGTQLVGRLPAALLPGNAPPAADSPVLDARSGTPRNSTLLTQPPRAEAAASAPGGAVEARIGADGQLTLVRVADNAAIGLPLGGPFAAVAFSPDGKRLAARAPDGSIQRWGAPYGLRIEFVGCAADAALTERAVELTIVMQRAIENGGYAVPPPTGPGTGALGTTARPVLDFIAYTGPAWARLHGRSAPAPRQIVHGPDLGRQAESLLTFLASNPATADTRWRLQPDPDFGGRIAVGLCGDEPAQATAGPPAIEGLTPREVLELMARVTPMFSADPARRIAATEALLNDAAAFSDAVHLAALQAWEFQAAGVTPGSPQMEGIYNALVLAAAAQPATLNRDAALLRRLAEAASANGQQTAAQATTLLNRLDAAAKRRPLVYVQHGGPEQRALAQGLLPALRQGGVDAPAVEDVGTARQPQRTQLRVQGLADRVMARRLAAQLGSQLGVAVEINATPLRRTSPTPTDTYELWLGADLAPATAAAAAPASGPLTLRIALCASETSPKPSARTARIAETLAAAAPKLGLQGSPTLEVLDPDTSAREREAMRSNGSGGYVMYEPITNPRVAEPGQAVGDELERLLGSPLEARPETPAAADVEVLVCPPDATPRTPVGSANKASPYTPAPAQAAKK